MGTNRPDPCLMGWRGVFALRRRDESFKEIEMGRKVLTAAAAMEIKNLRAMMDRRGAPLYSQMKIASMLGVSETTVFRVLNQGGAYGELPDAPTAEAANESAERFKQRFPNIVEGSALEKMEAAVAEVKAAPLRIDAELEELAAAEPPKGIPTAYLGEGGKWR